MTARSDDDVTRLAMAAKGGDRGAAADLIRHTRHDLLRFLRLLADANDVEDLAQETYLRAMRALTNFDARSTARTWLFAIARRAAADHVRLARRRPRTSPLEALDENSQRARTPQIDETVALRDLLAGLDPQRREAFVLTQVVGLSYDEAAQVCGCPVGTIRSRVSRAREELVAAVRVDTHQLPSTMDAARQLGGAGARKARRRQAG
ncbi:MAG TPA: sigma-70 family RNA polymerase sigma factor [Micromonosporaceae bacterium]|jgi:RNA polymerase sigma-70 factor (ECF subfamily)